LTEVVTNDQARLNIERRLNAQEDDPACRYEDAQTGAWHTSLLPTPSVIRISKFQTS
jgi:hypothetical protein